MTPLLTASSHQHGGGAQRSEGAGAARRAGLQTSAVHLPRLPDGPLGLQARRRPQAQRERPQGGRDARRCPGGLPGVSQSAASSQFPLRPPGGARTQRPQKGRRETRESSPSNADVMHFEDRNSRRKKTECDFRKCRNTSVSICQIYDYPPPSRKNWDRNKDLS